jgi:hypothetical protein
MPLQKLDEATSVEVRAHKHEVWVPLPLTFPLDSHGLEDDATNKTLSTILHAAIKSGERSTLTSLICLAHHIA